MKFNPDKQTPQSLAKILKNHLEKDILDFWLEHGIDRVDGGFLTSLSRQGEVYNTDKHSYTQTRMVYAFSEGYRMFGKASYKSAAQAGFEYYSRVFRDQQYDGWYNVLNRAGTPIDIDKRTYNFAFVVYCFSEYFGATGDRRALETVDYTLNLLDNRLADKASGGWYELMRRDWCEILNPGKTFNSPMHLMEAMLSGYENIDRDQFYPRLKNVVELIRQRCILPPENLCIEYFDPQWQPTLRNGKPVINYGHVVETAFFFLKLADILNNPGLHAQALQFIDFSMTHGWDEKVGMACFGTPDGEHDLIYCYWCQSETLAVLARAFCVTREEKYWKWLLKHVNVIFTQFADPEYGEWFIRCDPDGRVSENCKGASHKACYHLTQALAAAVNQLESLS
ncbi:AGE family epimerase/isomerase [candidate division KSB1 bacterium]|nr:AGE family epimerase/isomerase [candidate division KSB1 bacterium]